MSSSEGLDQSSLPPPAKRQRFLTATERHHAMTQARAKGLPDGWTVEWNNRKKCREWTSPDGTWKANGIPKGTKQTKHALRVTNYRLNMTVSVLQLCVELSSHTHRYCFSFLKTIHSTGMVCQTGHVAKRKIAKLTQSRTQERSSKNLE